MNILRGRSCLIAYCNWHVRQCCLLSVIYTQLRYWLSILPEEWRISVIRADRYNLTHPFAGVSLAHCESIASDENFKDTRAEPSTIVDVCEEKPNLVTHIIEDQILIWTITPSLERSKAIFNRVPLIFDDLYPFAGVSPVNSTRSTPPTKKSRRWRTSCLKWLMPPRRYQAWSWWACWSTISPKTKR